MKLLSSLPLRKFLPLGAALLALTSCDGIEETLPALRLVVLTDGGQTLGYVSSATQNGTGLTQAAALTDKAVNVDNLNSGRSFLLTTPASVEERGLDLAVTRTFTAAPITPACFTQSTMNAARDRLLLLSDCNSNQQLVLYRTDGSVVWRAQLPTKLVTVPGADAAPTRLAAGTADNAVISRADITGRSEVILVAPRQSGDPQLDLNAVVSLPVSTVKIYDLAPFDTSIYAATDTGIRPLLPATGQPDPNTVLTAFSASRYDRLWSGRSGARSLLAAWRDNNLSGNGSEPLVLWNGDTSVSAVTVSTFSDLRDVSIALDGRLYALSATTLSSYDTVLGLSGQRNWSPLTHTTGLKDARALTWLVEDTAN